MLKLTLDVCVHVQLCLTLCNSTDCTCQAPLSMEFSRQGYWSGLPFPTPGEYSQPRDEETGTVYRHFEANGQTTTTITVENVPYGIAMFMKYRLNNGNAVFSDAYVFTTISYGGITTEPLKGLVSDGRAYYDNLKQYHEGWVVGRINVLGNMRTNGILNSQQNSIPEGTPLAQSITITIVHNVDIDIEFFITDDGQDNLGVFPYLYESGNKYYIVQNTFGVDSGAGNRWREISYNGTAYSAAGTTVTDALLGSYKTPYLKNAK